MGALALAATALVLVAAVLGIASAFPYFAPVLMLLLPLLGGRYVGAERLERLARRRRRRPERARPTPALEPRRFDQSLLPRGGRLIGRALAVRPPPANAAA
jgi:hypothetical protein